jgi:tRNA threonylcarbamoyladenosine biosynthesis protein TsaE
MKSLKIKTHSMEETFSLGVLLGEEILKTKLKGPFIIGFSGNLGSGKTLFIQGLAKGLKIKNKIKSPTFLILRKYKVRHKTIKNFYHIDAYRIKKNEDIENSGIKDALKDKNALLAIEWVDIIKKQIPKIDIEIHLKHKLKNSREIIFKFYGKK